MLSARGTLLLITISGMQPIVTDIVVEQGARQTKGPDSRLCWTRMDINSGASLIQDWAVANGEQCAAPCIIWASAGSAIVMV